MSSPGSVARAACNGLSGSPRLTYGQRVAHGAGPTETDFMSLDMGSEIG